MIITGRRLIRRGRWVDDEEWQFFRSLLALDLTPEQYAFEALVAASYPGPRIVARAGVDWSDDLAPIFSPYGDIMGYESVNSPSQRRSGARRSEPADSDYLDLK